MAKYAVIGLICLWLAAPMRAAGPSHVDITMYWAGLMDKWRLDRQGVRSVPNAAVKQVLGF